MYNCYLTCPRGLEEMAQVDIANYANSFKVDKGGIKLTTDKEGLYLTIKTISLR